MTLRSALQDLRQTTLSAVSGILSRLSYIASLRRSEGGYLHWGLTLVHGKESSERALQTVHAEALSQVLRTPIADLVEDLQQSARNCPQTASAYVQDMQENCKELLPSPEDQASAHHLSSVLLALSTLNSGSDQSQKRATQSAS